jgi:CO/xanthine dehydrogenase FAD-binding subunit
MWPSIKSIEQPETLAAAFALVNPPQKVLFSGGSYLAADRSPDVDTLIDINALLGNEITDQDTRLRMAAGTTLEQLIQTLDQDKYPDLVSSARWSCPSKNIRNQRTIGGEIGQARTDSELLILLHCLGATLELEAGGTSEASLREWDGNGIVTSVSVAAADLHRSAFRRFALIPSAPAFVIVAGVRRNDAFNLAIGGQANRVTNFVLSDKERSAESISEIASIAAEQFTSDHYGTVAYKQRLIEIGTARVVGGL